jgi:hypothetical protein
MISMTDQPSRGFAESLIGQKSLDWKIALSNPNISIILSSQTGGRAHGLDTEKAVAEAPNGGETP